LSDIKRVRKALFFFRFCLERWLWQSEIVLSNSLAPEFYYQVDASQQKLSASSSDPARLQLLRWMSLEQTSETPSFQIHHSIDAMKPKN